MTEAIRVLSPELAVSRSIMDATVTISRTLSCFWAMVSSE